MAKTQCSPGGTLGLGLGLALVVNRIQERQGHPPASPLQSMRPCSLLSTFFPLNPLRKTRQAPVSFPQLCVTCTSSKMHFLQMRPPRVVRRPPRVVRSPWPRLGSPQGISRLSGWLALRTRTKAGQDGMVPRQGLPPWSRPGSWLRPLSPSASPVPGAHPLCSGLFLLPVSGPWALREGATNAPPVVVCFNPGGMPNCLSRTPHHACPSCATLQVIYGPRKMSPAFYKQGPSGTWAFCNY